tara:strand:+ start:5116 stop:6378 length:1263 start_codon:yes stop_codon:yes gene_type:complete
MSLDELDFDFLEFNSRKQIVFGADRTHKHFIKIEITKNPKKQQDIKGEYAIIEHLNNQNSQTCPRAHEMGVISKESLLPFFEGHDKKIVEENASEEFYYIIQDYVPDDPGHTLADLFLSMLEQKSLGVYQGDIKPANIRYDATRKICNIIDYDQATPLTQKQIELDNLSFLQFCSQHDKDRYGIGNWLRHFPEYRSADVENLFDIGGSFNLGQTEVFKTQVTTNSDSGFYHTIRERDIFIEGSRTLETRAAVLDNLSFEQGERVLDVGCNAGLLTTYLHDRGCESIGVDRDPHIIIAAKIVANILRKNIVYGYLDMDTIQELPECDTMMLFSVLHHTRDFKNNAKKVSTACKRIILETRLNEHGAQPISGTREWERTNKLQFPDLQQLTDFYEQAFEGFEFKNNLGLVDKHRYILEFVKL